MPEYTKPFTASKENLGLISFLSTWGSEEHDPAQMDGIQAEGLQSRHSDGSEQIPESFLDMNNVFSYHSRLRKGDELRARSPKWPVGHFNICTSKHLLMSSGIKTAAPQPAGVSIRIARPAALHTSAEVSIWSTAQTRRLLSVHHTQRIFLLCLKHTNCTGNLHRNKKAGHDNASVHET